MKCAALKNNADSCTQGISTGMFYELEGYTYRVCANHKKTIDNRVAKGMVLSHSMFDPTRRTQYSKVAVIGDTNIDLKSGVEITQERLPLEEEKKNMQFHLHSITKGGVKKGEGGFVRYFYWKKVKVNVANEGDLKAIIQRHFDREGENKAAFVITTRFGVLKGYKRSNMEGVELSNCSLQKSKFNTN